VEGATLNSISAYAGKVVEGLIGKIMYTPVCVHTGRRSWAVLPDPVQSTHPSTLPAAG